MRPLKVLLITYTFPPAGGVGVMRATSLAHHLPAEGIQLDVITARNASAVGTDKALLNKIPSAVNIRRTIAFDLPFRIKKGIRRLITGANTPSVKSSGGTSGLRSFFNWALQEVFLPDVQVMWLGVAARAARRIIRQRAIDLVLITVPPFSSVLLVEILRNEFPRLPIVVDFRDEWLSTTIDLVSFSRSERAHRIAHNAEASAVANATAIVAVTEAARREIRARYPLQPDDKFHLIPNGFDASQLPRSEPAEITRAGKKIVVTYVGTIYGSTEPTSLVQALQSLPSEVKSRFILRFIGRIEEPRFREALLQLGDMVELHGYLPQKEALAAMSETDYALLVTHDPLNVSAKFYDYLGAGKPILATVHAGGEVQRLMDELRAGWWVDSRDVEGIRRLFIAAAARAGSLAKEFNPDSEKIAQYERKVLAQRYARLLYTIAGVQRTRDLHTLAVQSAESGE